MNAMKCFLVVLFFILSLGSTLAETVYQTQSAGFDVDWTSPTLWSDGQTPSPGNDYVSDGFSLRMHGSAPVFAGRSFLVKGNGGINLKMVDMIGSFTNLVMNGGSVNVASSGHMTLAGDLAVADGGFYCYTSGDATRSLTVASLVTGSGPIGIGPSGSAVPMGGVTFSNAENTWSGDLAFLLDGTATFEYNLVGDSLRFGDHEGPEGVLDLDGRDITFNDLTIGADVYAAGVYTSMNLPARLQGAGTLTILSTPPQEIVLTSLDEGGKLSWTTAAAGSWSYRVEWASTPDGPWTNTWDHLTGIVSTQTIHEVSVPRFYRVVGVPEE